MVNPRVPHGVQVWCRWHGDENFGLKFNTCLTHVAVLGTIFLQFLDLPGTQSAKVELAEE